MSMDLSQLWAELAEEWERLGELDRAREARARAEEFRQRCLTSASPSAYEECAARFDELSHARSKAGRFSPGVIATFVHLTHYAAYLRLGCSPDVAEQATNGKGDVCANIVRELRNAKLTEEEARALEAIAEHLGLPDANKRD
jgi:hypothetical protein